MKTVGIAELEARLSEYLRGVRRGDELTGMDRATPVARIVPHSDDVPSLTVRRARAGAGLHAVKLPPRGVAGGLVEVECLRTLDRLRRREGLSEHGRRRACTSSASRPAEAVVLFVAMDRTA